MFVCLMEILWSLICHLNKTFNWEEIRIKKKCIYSWVHEDQKLVPTKLSPTVFIDFFFSQYFTGQAHKFRKQRENNKKLLPIWEQSWQGDAVMPLATFQSPQQSACIAFIVHRGSSPALQTNRMGPWGHVVLMMAAKGNWIDLSLLGHSIRNF